MADTVTITDPSDGATISWDDNTGSDGVFISFDYGSDTATSYDLSIRGTVRETGSVVQNASGSIDNTLAISGGSNISIEVELLDDSNNVVASDSITVSFDEPSAPSISITSAPSGTYTISKNGSITLDWDFQVETTGIPGAMSGDVSLDVNATTVIDSTWSSGSNNSYTYDDSFDSDGNWLILAKLDYYYDGDQLKQAQVSDGFTIEENDHFEITITGDNSPVVEGDDFVVQVDIENTGDQSGTQDVTLFVDGVGRDTKTFTLSSGETTSTNLSWTTSSGDAGSYNPVVAPSDDGSSDSTSLTVEVQEPFFEVTHESSNDPVQPLGTLEVTSTIENTGNSSGSQTVTMFYDNNAVDSISVSLDVGESTTITHQHSDVLNGLDYGFHTVGVSSDDDAYNITVTVGDFEQGLSSGPFFPSTDETSDTAAPRRTYTKEAYDQDFEFTYRVKIRVPQDVSSYDTLSVEAKSGNQDAYTFFQVDYQAKAEHDHAGNPFHATSSLDNIDSEEIVVTGDTINAIETLNPDVNIDETLTADNVQIAVDGTDVTNDIYGQSDSGTNQDQNIDLTEFVSEPGWHTITITPNTLTNLTGEILVDHVKDTT